MRERRISIRSEVKNLLLGLLAGEIFIFYFSKKLKINNLRKISSINDLQIGLSQKKYDYLFEQFEELKHYIFMQQFKNEKILRIKRYRDEDLIESVLEKNSITFSKFYEHFYSHLNPFTKPFYRFNESEKNTIKINTKNLLKLLIKQFEYDITNNKYFEDGTFNVIELLDKFYKKNNLTSPEDLIKFLSVDYYQKNI